jgi:hypothetical protein
LSRYFLHLRNGRDELLDEEGRECVTIDALHAHVLFTARDLMRGDLENGVLDLRYRIEAGNEAGEIVYILPFKHAVSVIPEAV